MRKIVLIAFFVVSIALVAPAWAYTVVPDSYEEGNSWSQEWLQNTSATGGSQFDKIEMFLMDDKGLDFESLADITNPWTGSIINPDFGLVEGGQISSVNFRTWFTGNPVVGFSFDILTWLGDELVAAEWATYVGGSTNYGWTNGSYTLTGFDPDAYDRSPVPIPTGVWLLGSGVLGIVGLRRRLA